MPADCSAANAARAHAMHGVLSSSGTRLAPTEAARRPVACCFERPEQLQYFTVFIIAKEIGDVNQRKILCRKCTGEGQKCAFIASNFRCS